MASTPHRVFPHDLPTPCAKDLWRVVGSLPFPLKRNMFLHRLPTGGLLIYSAVAMDAAGMAALEALGTPEIMVVPHPFHLMDAPFYKARYPALRVLALPDAQARLATVRVDEAPDKALSPHGIGVHVAPGLAYGEVVLDLPVDGGRALLFTDVLGQNEGPVSLMMKLLGPPGGAGVARIVRFRQVRDKVKLRAFLEEKAATPNLRLVAGCHGGVVTSDAAGWLRRAAAGL